MITCNLYKNNIGDFIQTASFAEMPRRNETIEIDGKLYVINEVRYVIINDNSPVTVNYPYPSLYISEVDLDYDGWF